MTLNQADYSRYLCEVLTNESQKSGVIIETEAHYSKYFEYLKIHNIAVVNPANITGYYNFAIFLYEIKDKKTDAIKLLKDTHQNIILNLDLTYKIYPESYYLLDLLVETMTSWIINTNYANINK